MSEQQQAKFEGWAIVDVMGHQRYVGFVTTEAYGQAVLFRIDVPALGERERVTKHPEYSGFHGGYVPPGSTVQEGAVAGYTKLIGSGSIYAISPCTQAAALAAVEEAQRRPLMQITLPEGRALMPPDRDDNPDDYGGADGLDDEDDEDDGEEVNDMADDETTGTGEPEQAPPPATSPQGDGDSGEAQKTEEPDPA